MSMPHTDAALAQQAIRNDTHRPALTENGDRTILRLDLDEHGREASDRAGSEIRKPLRVRSDNAHAASMRGLHHPPLRLLAGDRIAFAESRRHQDCDLDAARRAVRDRSFR